MEKLTYEELKNLALESLNKEERALNELKNIDRQISVLKNENDRLNRQIKKYQSFFPIKLGLKMKKFVGK
ncbi:hypothetical protein LNK15_05540 [Jeotgalicoccus huakuii]|uniref:hypothetical protein n=1 Tax=Jeotgalicoccus TaxID=227979 RepID=UPI000418B523|nr:MULTISPECIES: hypothetical protein [Jeotgalicoccus]MCK1976518.1 hypothetical protein [Jeotgalicoccus huakuii]QQD85875.1 hypothetical protein JEM45_04425 [Jeotgalicoccus sp. ATCC 8456]